MTTWSKKIREKDKQAVLDSLLYDISEMFGRFHRLGLLPVIIAAVVIVVVAVIFYSSRGRHGH